MKAEKIVRMAHGETKAKSLFRTCIKSDSKLNTSDVKTKIYFVLNAVNNGCLAGKVLSPNGYGKPPTTISLRERRQP